MTDTAPSLREQLVAAIDNLPVAYWTPGRLADAVLRIVQPEFEQAVTVKAERDEARQHAAAIAAQRDRLRQRMNSLGDRWERDAPPPGNRPLTELRAEITCDPFHPDATLVVQQYRADDGSQKWAARCWGTDTCDGWLSLDHDTQRWAEVARDRHLAEDHTADDPGDLTGAYIPDPPIGCIDLSEGPSVQEAAADDRRWPLEKAGE